MAAHQVLAVPLLELSADFRRTQKAVEAALAELRGSAVDLAREVGAFAQRADAQIGVLEARYAVLRERKLTTDELIADFLLRHGLQRSAAKLVAELAPQSRGMIDELAEMRAAAVSLRSGSLGPAMEWVQRHASRLRRVGSTLEFDLRVQEFVELLRAGDRHGAIAHATTYLAPAASTSSSSMTRLQELMGALAFPSPASCGISQVEALFATEAWVTLETRFLRDATLAAGLLRASPLRIALHAGIAALKSPWDAPPSRRPNPLANARRRWLHEVERNPDDSALLPSPSFESLVAHVVLAPTAAAPVAALWPIRASVPRLRRTHSLVLCALTGRPLRAAAVAPTATEAAVPDHDDDDTHDDDDHDDDMGHRHPHLDEADSPLGSSDEASGGAQALHVLSDPGRPLALPCGRVVGDAALLRCELRRRARDPASESHLDGEDSGGDALAALRRLGTVRCPFSNDDVPAARLRRLYL